MKLYNGVIYKCCWLVCLVMLTILAYGGNQTYYPLGVEHGLKGLNVLQMIQLEDGRMVMVTGSYVNIYDGMSFQNVRRDAAAEADIKGYKGHTHLYVDSEQRLWIKDYGKVSCLSLRTLRFIQPCDSSFFSPAVVDFFVDSEKDIWLIESQRVVNKRNGVELALPERMGEIQDLDVSENRVYVFTHHGEAWVFEAESGRLVAVCPAYGKDERHLFDRTSLVVHAADGRFYQIRTGTSRSVFLSFDSQEMSWNRLLESNASFHTLIVTSARVAYLSTSEGYIEYDLRTHAYTHLDALRLPDGTMLTTGFNTVCQDREGGIWLGSYDNGVLYSSPLSGIFDTREITISLYPVLLSVYMHGQKMDVGNGGLSADAPYVEHLDLDYDDNDLTFLFSAMKYVHPRSVYYRYRILGLDEKWNVVSADSAPDMVDDGGRFRLSFVDLSPGRYVLEVMASADSVRWDGNVRRVGFTIRHPWWATLPAYAAYGFVFLVLLCLSFWLYVRRVRHRVEQKNREDMLLIRIQNLIEKCNQYESAVNVVLTDKTEQEEEMAMSDAEMDFLNRATAFVEQNISNSSYSVEQLSRDICMERSGLYKRLTSILDKSPVAFIRMIRLRRAVELLKQGDLTIAEVAEATGFSSPSYFSKCFQKEYGCKPSEYLQQCSEDGI